MGLLKDLFSPGDDRPRRLLPPDTSTILEELGRYEGPAPGGDPIPGLDLGRTVKNALKVDPERVLDEIIEACDSVRGWSFCGAWEILSTYASDREDDPRYVYIIDGLLDTLEDEGYGPGSISRILPPRVIARHWRHHWDEQPASPAAERAPEPEPEIPPLAEGERRLLQVVDRPDGNQNKIYLIHRRASDRDDWQFVAVVHFSEDTAFGFDTESAWMGGEDERAVYIRVAEAYANTRTASVSYWLEPSVQWFADRVR